MARKGPRGDSVDKEMPCDRGFAHRAKHPRAINRAKKPASEMVICTAERGKEAHPEQTYVGVAIRVGAASFIREPFEEAAQAA